MRIKSVSTHRLVFKIFINEMRKKQKILIWFSYDILLISLYLSIWLTLQLR